MRLAVPSINLRRVYLIARRDFLGYVKTWGFWISFFIPFVFGALGLFFATLDIDVSPTRYETILDETGRYEQAILNYHEERQASIRAELDAMLAESEFFGRIMESSGVRKQTEKKPDLIFVSAPSQNMEELKSYLKGEKKLGYDGDQVELTGVLHIKQDEGISIEYWSPNFNNDAVPSLARRFFQRQARIRYLESGGLTLEGYNNLVEEGPSVEKFDPTKIIGTDADSQAVKKEDKIPYIIATMMAGMLWLIVFSGSYMLLTSMLEEKLNKLLEMMLASTRFSEIIFGKLLGVAAMTITAMLPYILLGIGTIVIGILYGGPEIAAIISQTFSVKMIVFFIIFMILGYIFYGSFFIALGALSESMQDAQTLTTPIMLVLTACILVVPLGLNDPDSPLLVFASWFPLSAPFAAIIRLPSDPPLWELCASAFFLFLLTLGVIALCGRMFRHGVLAGSGMGGIKDWFARTILRRKGKA